MICHTHLRDWISIRSSRPQISSWHHTYQCWLHHLFLHHQYTQTGTPVTTGRTSARLPRGLQQRKRDLNHESVHNHMYLLQNSLTELSWCIKYLKLWHSIKDFRTTWKLTKSRNQSKIKATWVKGVSSFQHNLTGVCIKRQIHNLHSLLWVNEFSFGVLNVHLSHQEWVGRTWAGNAKQLDQKR